MNKAVVACVVSGSWPAFRTGTEHSMPRIIQLAPDGAAVTILVVLKDNGITSPEPRVSQLPATAHLLRARIRCVTPFVTNGPRRLTRMAHAEAGLPK